MMYKLLSLFLFLNFSFAYSQSILPTETEISVLTIGPGDSLNDSFGHCAFRVKNNKIDVVYDYGRFDFNAPNFYLNFAKGKLNYFMGGSSFQDFKGFYIWQNRTIKEQKLNLTPDSKKELYQFLANNIKPENKFYLYDFFYNNCATKIRDVLEHSIDSNIEFNEPNDFKAETFRALIQQNLNWNSWGSFGIDLALGAVIDKEATYYEHMFLPDYIHKSFANAKFSKTNNPLVKDTKTTFKSSKKPKASSFFSSPLFIFSLIALLIIYMTHLDYKKQKRSKWLDILIFAITGIIGVFLLLLWFATDHEATAQNYNLLWAFVLNLFVILQVFKLQPKSWFISYLKFLIIMLCLLVLHWVIGIQRFSLALIPILIALLLRYLFLVKHLRTMLKF